MRASSILGISGDTMIYRRTEGQVARTGINWDTNQASTWEIIIKMGWLQWYSRRRSTALVSAPEGKVLARYVFNFYFTPRYNTGMSGFKLDFDTRSLVVNGKKIPLEVVDDWAGQVFERQEICSKF